MKKGSAWKVWFSARRSVYLKIARKFRVTPWKVYYLAHGNPCKRKKGIEILEELQKRGIITKIYPW